MLLEREKASSLRMLKGSNVALVALLKTGDRVGLVVAVIFFSQVFEKKLQRSLSRSGAGMSVMSIQPLIFPWQEALNLCQSSLFFFLLFFDF